MRLRLHPEASFEAIEARTWIGGDDPHQGEMFAVAVAESFQRIKRSPLICRRFDGEFRRTRVGKFRYSVIFRIHGDEIQVMAVMHQHRRPGYWKARTGSWPK